MAESVLPPNIERVERGGMDVLDHSSVHATAGAAPAAGLACVVRLVNAKENIHPTELSLVLLFLGRRIVIQGEAGLQEQLGGKQCSSCTHVLKSTHPR